MFRTSLFIIKGCMIFIHLLKELLSTYTWVLAIVSFSLEWCVLLFHGLAFSTRLITVTENLYIHKKLIKLM
jgi:hypothetical protein